MKRNLVWVALVLCGCAAEREVSVDGAPAKTLKEETGVSDTRRDLEPRFGEARGCFVLLDLGRDRWVRVFPELADERLTPCSTFKVFNSLAGLDAGVLRDAETAFAWDGTPQSRPVCARDHTLQTAMRHSVVWYYQRVATGVGAPRMQRYLRAVGYGNEDTSAGLTRFWLDRDSLKISANEQAAFLARLYRSELPFSASAQRTVRKILVQKRYPDGTVLSGKTGSGRRGPSGLTLGWFVGHLERPDGAWVFATNLRAPEATYGGQARSLTLRLLRDLDLLPRGT